MVMLIYRDLLKSLNYNPSINDFLNTVMSLDLAPVIVKATHSVNNSAKILDSSPFNTYYLYFYTSHHHKTRRAQYIHCRPRF